jgi:hypothetical protein
MYWRGINEDGQFLMVLRTSRPRLAVHDTRTGKPRPKQADAALLTPEHRAWRLAVCRRAGWRCEWLEDGRRCEASTQRGDRLFADHVVERASMAAHTMARGARSAVRTMASKQTESAQGAQRSGNRVWGFVAFLQQKEREPHGSAPA